MVVLLIQQTIYLKRMITIKNMILIQILMIQMNSILIVLITLIGKRKRKNKKWN